MVAFQRVISLFVAPEIYRLLYVFCGAWFVGFISYCFAENEFFSAVGKSFYSLFVINFAEKPAWLQVVLGICFFVVWLIGGGVLVSVLVAQQRRNDNGEFRLWKWLCSNHVVFLGWDENVPSLLKKEFRKDDHKIGIIVTMCDIDYVRKSIDAASIDAGRVFIYKGLYDDDIEWNKLNAQGGKAIYVMGEGNEEAHDSRVILLARTLSRHLGEAQTPMYANIRDFGLAVQLKDRKKGYSYNMTGGESLGKVEFLNFHLDSAGKMLRRVYDGKAYTHVIVIGFGAMGKAVVVKGLKLGFMANAKIVVSDDENKKLDMEVRRFEGLFPEYSERVAVKSYDECLDGIANAQEDDAWLVVVAKHRSEKGFVCLSDVLSAIGENKFVKVALNQEVKCDLWHDEKENPNEFAIGSHVIELFGFRRGDMSFVE